jgi:hypothetical protein
MGSFLLDAHDGFGTRERKITDRHEKDWNDGSTPGSERRAAVHAWIILVEDGFDEFYNV